MAFERKGIKVNSKKTKVMVCGSEEAPKSGIDQCGVCSGRVIANSMLYVYYIEKMDLWKMCENQRESSEERVKPIKTMRNEVETVLLFGAPTRWQW